MGSDFKFVHCADLHLGSRFRGVSERDAEAGRRMREAAFESLGRIVDLVITEEADALVISGDIYDDCNALPSTRSRLCSELSRACVPVFISRGNHDSSTSWDDSIPYPENVHEFGTDPESITVHSKGGDFEVVGVSFGTPHEERNLASMLRGRQGIFTIACVHCDVDSVSEGLSYAPCRLQDLQGRGVDYWALGHIHKRQVLSDNPHVVYPGNIQGRSFRETGPKGAYLVTVSSDVIRGLRFVPTQSMMWHDISVDITGRVLDDLVSDISARIRKGDLVRMTFVGSGPLDGMLRTDATDVVSVLEARTGCRIASWDLDTTPDFDVWSVGGGEDLASKVVSAGRSLCTDGSAIMDRILSNPVLARHRDFFESLSDEELSDIVEDAARLVVAGMGVSR